MNFEWPITWTITNDSIIRHLMPRVFRCDPSACKIGTQLAHFAHMDMSTYVNRRSRPHMPIVIRCVYSTCNAVLLSVGGVLAKKIGHDVQIRASDGSLKL